MFIIVSSPLFCNICPSSSIYLWVVLDMCFLSCLSTEFTGHKLESWQGGDQEDRHSDKITVFWDVISCNFVSRNVPTFQRKLCDIRMILYSEDGDRMFLRNVVGPLHPYFWKILSIFEWALCQPWPREPRTFTFPRIVITWRTRELVRWEGPMIQWPEKMHVDRFSKNMRLLFIFL
jgi:hypothetical protein